MVVSEASDIFHIFVISGHVSARIYSKHEQITVDKSRKEREERNVRETRETRRG